MILSLHFENYLKKCRLSLTVHVCSDHLGILFSIPLTQSPARHPKVQSVLGSSGKIYLRIEPASGKNKLILHVFQAHLILLPVKIQFHT